MKCCGSTTRDPDPAGSPCPGAPGLRWFGLGPDLRPSRHCQAATAVRPPRLLGPRPRLQPAEAFAGRQRCRGEPLARQAAGGLRASHIRWLQPGRSLGHRGGWRSPGPRPRPKSDRRTAPHPTSGGRGAGVSDDDKECRFLPTTGLSGCETSAADGITSINR